MGAPPAPLEGVDGTHGNTRNPKGASPVSRVPEHERREIRPTALSRTPGHSTNGTNSAHPTHSTYPAAKSRLGLRIHAPSAIRGPYLPLGHPGNAAELAGEGVPLHVVQAQFGHSNLAVTSRYVSHLQPQAVVDAMQARRWE